ncbi:MAG: hypothetical protein CMH54_00525 [Myxococcales bacterium]|nr:hypothetical protein [Myxococcales bacterium]|tara:strand:- start:863 stop:1270 length:408 start_codon:yes stop_codon:yes gene_type:complete
MMTNPMMQASVPLNSGYGSSDNLSVLAATLQNSGDKPKELLEASRQLESVFLNTVFEEMAKSVPDDNPLFPETPGREMYEQWFRSAVAKDWAAHGGIGLGDKMARSMGLTEAQINTANEQLRRTAGMARYREIAK